MGRKVVTVLLVVATVFGIAAYARAQTITREGTAYSGYANPHGCNIWNHEGGVLHVNCKKGDGGPARIRYRFLRADGGTFDAADVSVDWQKQARDSNASVRWMVPVPRTVRVIVRGYVHINSITWTQPKP